MMYQKNSKNGQARALGLSFMFLLFISIASISSASAQIGIEIEDWGRIISTPHTAVHASLAPAPVAREIHTLPTHIVNFIKRLFIKTKRSTRMPKHKNQARDRRQTISVNKPSLRSS